MSDRRAPFGIASQCRSTSRTLPRGRSEKLARCDEENDPAISSARHWARGVAVGLSAVWNVRVSIRLFGISREGASFVRVQNHPKLALSKRPLDVGDREEFVERCGEAGA